MRESLKPPVRVAVFVRVSTKAQDYTRQLEDLQTVALSRGWQIVEVFTEKISGSTVNAKRPELQRLLDLASPCKRAFDKVLVSEISRLGRRTSEVLQVIEQLTEYKVSVFANNYQLETLDQNYKRNPLANMLFTFLAEFARLEKETLVQRINSGLDSARAKGVKLGRKPGSTKDDEQLLKQYPKVVKEIKAGTSIRKAAKICEVAEGTIKKVKAAYLKSLE